MKIERSVWKRQKEIVPPGHVRPRFIADAMLGRLARRLRLMGFDTLYNASVGDEELVLRSLLEGRILLTRDRKINRRRALRVMFLDSAKVGEQLQQVLKETRERYRRHAFFTRCSLCNTILVPTERYGVRNQVPVQVYRRYRKFSACPACHKVYWFGTHRRLFQRVLAMETATVSIGKKS